MKITAAEFIEYFKSVAEMIEREKDYLCELDRKLGDGDHGVTMSIGWQAVNQKLNNELADEKDCGKISSTIGMTFLNAVGSSVGPLYATGFLRGGKAVAQKSELTDQDLVEFWIAFINGVKDRGQAKAGDKTMIDTLEPALIALQDNAEASQNFTNAFNEAVIEAERGMKSTIELVSKIGRSSRLGDRSIGVQDPGATSAYFILSAFLKFVKEL
ncbi:dihydroxyacetone kinase subunit DhaL [Neobacillus niacini]|uniref:dihydroxyacetone kinase subunit DhaL n=1 Tax=Neobacillus niacini TaxID=86668 RepID=UPI00203DB7EE|nr:dihydroxyacetone kinase subunit DhaL [Neobacillus niacini]MCM3693426.1 dihydroxyacetone kinase subunit DhaL [Neobacillus niacini]